VALRTAVRTGPTRGEISQADYAQANSEFDSEITVIEEQLEVTRMERISLESFVRFSKAMLVDVASAWRLAGADDRLRVQNLLFGNSLLYSQESENFEHLNPCLFNVMEGVTEKN
jgi:hypothetical protein